MQALLALILVIGFAVECYVATRIYHTYKLVRYEKRMTQSLLVLIHEKIRRTKR